MGARYSSRDASSSSRGRIALIIAFSFRVAAGSDYAGSAACQPCHPVQSEVQSKSEHALALAHSKTPQRGEWAFGAGQQAITFVSRAGPDHYKELGLTWYRTTNSLALTPGHRSAEGVLYRIFDPSAAILRCFACHSTGRLAFDDGESIVPAELGIRCEACHGAAAAHARNPVTVRMRSLKTLTANDQNQLCGTCHRMPASTGDATNLYNPWNARHEPLLLSASRCFGESAGQLSCTTCHSPHTALESRSSHYDAVCGKCHAQPKHSFVVGGRSCVNCHMPKVRPQANLTFRNHRIGVYSAQNPMVPVQ